ncbi:MAG TPA: hypothetical protein VIX84_10860 [Acidimicrobiales bacterium]
MSEESESGSGEQGGKGPLRRTLDVCVFAPVGAAVTLAEELPEFVEKGRRRVELQLGNARVVGRFVVHKGRRDLAGRLEEILNNGVAAARAAEEAERAEEAAGDRQPDASAAVPVTPGAPDANALMTPAPRTAPDPVTEATVQRSLSDYDTLSASQVVRRLESLGQEELRAVQRYEASHRNRRTILNRASQLLEAAAPGSSTG